MRQLAYVMGRQYVPPADVQYLIGHPRALLFLYLSIKDAEDSQHVWAERMLGVRVTAEQVHGWAGTVSRSHASTSKPDYAYIPVLGGLKDKEYWKHVSESVAMPVNAGPPVVGMGEYHPDPGEQIHSMSTASKEAWMKFFGNAGIFNPNATKPISKRDPDADAGILNDTTSKDEHLNIMESALGPRNSKRKE